MFFTLTLPIMVPIFCYHASNSRWRPIWPAKVVKFAKKLYIGKKKISAVKINKFLFLTL